MTVIYGDRVQETFTTTGTGTVTLAGPVTGYQAFSAILADTNTCYYAATDGTNWEVGLGTYATAGNTLARTSVLASSNGGSAVNWLAGTKSIWLDLPASAIAGFAFSPLSGTWTPVLSFSTPGDLSVAYSFQSGSYIKIGRQVTVFYNVSTSAFTHTTSSGTCIITGLPFAAAFPDTNNQSYGNISFQGITKAGYTAYVTECDNGNSNLAVTASGSGVPISVVQAADMPTGGTVVLTGMCTYMAAS